MYNLKSCGGEEAVLCQLQQLQHLDVSDDRDHPLDLLHPLRHDVSWLLRDPHRFPHLVSLDLSGKDGLTVAALRSFLEAHPKMRFLGLMQTDACFDDFFTRELPSHSDLVITGCADERQILEALRRYPDRPYYVQKSLYYLYQYTLSYSQPRVDVIQISTSETSSLGAKPEYMERLLRIVKSKLYAGEVDIMMKFTLSALWNLTG
ncbi:hypothetical protein V5799_011743 [Amblyomma americanum]|uniref:Protein zer-1 homolog-like C-terminal domain-containing protein n=1 Tax=Amblyomma americanum TaxID=6943 RepID=A0AAQ4EFY7_AMBAM